MLLGRGGLFFGDLVPGWLAGTQFVPLVDSIRLDSTLRTGGWNSFQLSPCHSVYTKTELGGFDRVPQMRRWSWVASLTRLNYLSTRTLPDGSYFCWLTVLLRQIALSARFTSISMEYWSYWQRRTQTQTHEGDLTHEHEHVEREREREREREKESMASRLKVNIKTHATYTATLLDSIIDRQPRTRVFSGQLSAMRLEDRECGPKHVGGLRGGR